MAAANGLAKALVVLSVTVIVGAGCSESSVGVTPTSDVTPAPLADYTTPLPSHVRLPQGFYPLAGHYDEHDAGDSYDGWPRYIVSEKDEMIMVYVPTQTIVMGGGLEPDEEPARHVIVNHFYIDLHEVSNAQFNRFYKTAVIRNDPTGPDWRPGDAITVSDPDYAGAMGRPWKVSNGYAEYWRPSHNNHHPVRNVSWWEAWSYTRWSNKALPTEAQWEAAARGNDERIYPWGNSAENEITRYLCNAETERSNFDGYEYVAPVLSYAGGVSPYGVFQMAGNVWEWCADWYDPSRYAYPSDEDPPTDIIRGPKPFGDRHYPNPILKIIRESRVGPLRGGDRVVRGGSYSDPIERCRVDARTSLRPDVRKPNVGFRCVLPLPPLDETMESEDTEFEMIEIETTEIETERDEMIVDE